MNLSEDDIKLIEGKIDGSLNDQEQGHFDQLLDNSEEFETEYNFQKAVIDSLVASEREELRSELHGYLKEARTNEQANSKKGWLVAASVTLALLGSLVYYFAFNQPTDPADLYQAYFEVYPAPPITRGAEDESLALYDNYRKENYALALEDFKAFSDAEQNLLYLSMCHLKINQLDEAIAILAQLIHSKNTKLSQTSKWYLGLSYLKIGDKEKSQLIFKEIVAKNQLYKTRASSILDQLD